MVNADSDEGERSSERSDGCRSVSFHLDTHGSSLSYSLWCTCTKRDEGLWSLWAALAPSKEGWETRAPSARVSRLCRGVFHASGRIHRPGASRRPPRMPHALQEPLGVALLALHAWRAIEVAGRDHRQTVRGGHVGRHRRPRHRVVGRMCPDPDEHERLRGLDAHRHDRGVEFGNLDEL